jgi:hypothetical protein
LRSSTGCTSSEYALRDYLAVEKYTTPTSVVVVDDTLPRTVDEAARHRHTTAWTGDVYKAAQALRQLCPELIVLDVDTQPTGLVVGLTPDAGRRGVLPGHDDWLDIAMAPDPRNVPEEVLNRSRVHDPEKLLASAGWRELPRRRAAGKSIDRATVQAAFADVLG